MDAKPTVSVVMIVKNEEQMLARCLESVRDADEIVICDTGSDDRTIEIARLYTDKVFTDYKWNDSYCEARNHAKSKATKEWILSIDADEQLLVPIDNVRRAASLACFAAECGLIAGDGKTRNFFPRLFKNAPHIQWDTDQDIHNIPNVGGERISTPDYPCTHPDNALVQIRYDYSPAHAQDPDRTLRILEKSLKKNPRNVRAMFYLGREYYYKDRREEALVMLGRYVQMSSFLAEKAEAFLIMSQIYFMMGMGEDARDACLQALKINANFKEAVAQMATLCGDGRGNPAWQRNADQWKRMARTATNDDVLFVRTVDL